MLTQLKFSNFKSWKTLRIEFGKITGLFVTNSSGKTSIIQFILLPKQTKEATDNRISIDLNGAFVQLGTIRDAIHGHDETQLIDFSIGFRREDELIINDPSGKRGTSLARSKDFSIDVSLDVLRGALRATLLRYKVGNILFCLAPKSGDETHFELTAEGSDFRFFRTTGRPWQLPGPIKSYAFPDQARTYFQNASLLSDLEFAYETEIDRIYYLGPLREYPQRDYLWARSRPTDVGERGEKAIDAILAASEAGEKRNLGYKRHRKSFQEMIAHWLRAMGLIESFVVEEIAPGSNRWQVRIKTTRESTEVLLTDVGFGVSQISLMPLLPVRSTSCRSWA